MSASPPADRQYPHFGLHHHVPLLYGRRHVGIPRPLSIAAVDEARARQPVNPGMLPVYHIPLRSPDSLRLLPPPGVDLPSAFPDAPPTTARPVIPAAVPTAVSSAAAIAAPPPPAADPPLIRMQTPAPPRPAVLENFDPIFAYLLYLALGFGTAFLLDVGARYVLMWGSLIIMGGILHLLDAPRGPGRLTTTDVTWGIGIGFLLGLPLILLSGPGLAAAASILFPDMSSATLFQLMALTAPLGETLFFRGALQEKRGFASSVIAVAFASAVLYWPTAVATPVYLGVGIIFSTALAAVYSYARSRYGLAAAFLCQSTANLMLVFFPAILISPTLPVL